MKNKFYRVIKNVDGKPLEMNGKELNYTKGEAIKKARMFDGKIEPLSEEENDQEILREALENLKFAFTDVLTHSGWEKEFGSKYPFQKNFCEVVDDIIAWVDDEIGREEKQP